MQAGVVGPLVHLSRSGSEVEKRMAAMALANVGHGRAENQDVILASGGTPFVVDLLQSKDDLTAISATTYLSMLMKRNRGGQFAVAQAGAVPLLVQLAKSGSDTQRVEAVCALKRLVDGNRFHQSTAAETGIINIMQRPEPTVELKNSSVRALGKLAERHANNQTRIVNSGVVKKLVTDWTTADVKMKGSIAMVLGYIAEDEIALAMIESLEGTHIINEQNKLSTISDGESKSAD